MKSDIEIQPGQVTKVFSKKETWELQKLWMNIFCKDKQGGNTKAYKWHIFSFEKYPSVAGDKAKEIYQSQRAVEYIVLSNDSELAIETNKLPKESNLSDYYVFPRNFAWTMAFTHEEGWCGPYFAKHPEYESLVAENEKKVKKKHDYKIARNNGWA